ncbi:MAG: ThuA domain-containing protein [Gracilimonas sp.]|nr:ThuA domain-containing protein [Gracilimonas sp.]
MMPPISVPRHRDDHLDFHRIDEKEPLFRAIVAEEAIDLTVTTDCAETRPATPRRVRRRPRLHDGAAVEHVDAIRNFVRGGGGYVGVHSAMIDLRRRRTGRRSRGADRWPLSHPPRSVDVRRPDPPSGTPITDGVDDFEVFDEPYDVSLEDDPDVHVLAEMDHPEMAGTPVAWVREEGDGSRSLLLARSHDEAFEHPTFQRLVRRGVRWTADESP